jgi:hypothetical protein
MSASDAPGGGLGRAVVRSLPALALAAGGSVLFLLVVAVGAGLDVVIALGLLAAILVGAAVAYRLIFGSVKESGGIAARRALVAAAVGFAVVMAAAQAVPYGRDYTDPPVVAEPAWDSPRTRQLAVDACFACHSNEPRRPWYAVVAPFSWALADTIAEGREAMNFSDWDNRPMGAGRIAEVVENGEMPPWNYRLAHPSARLDDAEQAELIAGIRATLGS